MASEIRGAIFSALAARARLGWALSWRAAIRPASARSLFNSEVSFCSWRVNSPICSRSCPACWFSRWSSFMSSRMRSSTPLSPAIWWPRRLNWTVASSWSARSCSSSATPRRLDLVETLDDLPAFAFGQVDMPLLGGAVGGRRMPQGFPHDADPLAQDDQLMFGEFWVDGRLFGLQPS